MATLANTEITINKTAQSARYKPIIECPILSLVMGLGRTERYGFGD